MAIYIKVNEDRDINVKYLDSRGKPLSLTGATVTATISAAATPSVVALTKTTTTYLNSAGASVALDSTGVATITLSDTEVDTLGAGSYVMDAKVRDNSGHDSVSNTYDIEIKARRS